MPEVADPALSTLGVEPPVRVEGEVPAGREARAPLQRGVGLPLRLQCAGVAGDEQRELQEAREAGLRDAERGEEPLLVREREVRERLGEDVGGGAVGQLEAHGQPADVGHVVGHGRIAAAVREPDLGRHRLPTHVAGAREARGLGRRREGADAMDALRMQSAMPVVRAEARVDLVHRLLGRRPHGTTLVANRRAGRCG